MITREFDTIAAISDPLVKGAIGIVQGTDKLLVIAQKIKRQVTLEQVLLATLLTTSHS